MGSVSKLLLLVVVAAVLAVTSSFTGTVAAASAAAPLLSSLGAAASVMPPGCFHAFSSSSCLAIPGCKWDTRLMICFPHCDNVSSRASCAAVPWCRWVPTNATGTLTEHCNNACDAQFSNAAECLHDTYCEWETSTTQAVCAPSCAYAMDAINPEEVCRADSDCVWAGTTVHKSCRVVCDKIPTEKMCSERQPDCTWDGATSACRRGGASPPSPPPTNCTSLGANATACALNPFCCYNPLLQRCDTLCAVEPTVASCLANPSCTYLPVQSMCAKRCELAYNSTTQEACSVANAGRCVWIAATGSCVDACGRRTTAGSCTNANADCMWNVNTQMCVPDCRAAPDQATCLAISPSTGCSWDPQTALCAKAAPAPPPPTPTPPRRPTCYDHSVMDCLSGKYPNCTFNGLLQLCTPKCTMYGPRDLAGCLSDPSCDFVAGECVDICQFTARSNPANCNASRGCGWNASAADTFYCQANCAAYGEYSSCLADSNCQWIDDAGLCANSCRAASSPDLCNAVPSGACEWNSVTRSCTPASTNDATASKR